MPNPKFTKTEIIIIVVFFILYTAGSAYLLEPRKDIERERKKPVVQSPYRQEGSQRREVGAQQVESLSSSWPLDLGRYYYTLDIAPDYEMEDEEYEIVGKSGGKLIVRKHNDWPVISGHFEWYCNEKLTTTQQMFDYVMAHHKVIVRQMKEVKRRGISHQFDEASYYQDHYDEYRDDPEDELRFPPEIFEANDD